MRTASSESFARRKEEGGREGGKGGIIVSNSQGSGVQDWFILGVLVREGLGDENLDRKRGEGVRVRPTKSNDR